MGDRMVHPHEQTMARHLRWLTGALALALAAARLTRLLQPTTSGPSWVAVVLAMAVMGGVITWVAASYRISWISVASINLVAIVIAGLRIIAPETLAFGLVPTPETFDALASEVSFAAEVFRFGAAPVLPIPGLVAAIGSLFWVFGALLAASAVLLSVAFLPFPPFISNGFEVALIWALVTTENRAQHEGFRLSNPELESRFRGLG